ncbi:hypothetical protein OROMI_012622 [Orobanche minor]
MADSNSKQDIVVKIREHEHAILQLKGSADKTMKFWDLETFEITGSARCEFN